LISSVAKHFVFTTCSECPQRPFSQLKHRNFNLRLALLILLC